MRSSAYGVHALSCSVVLSLGITATATAQDHLNFAPTPPMGWNSWDTYGSSVTEAEVRQNALFMRDNLLQFGWEFVVVDIRWYVNNPGTHGYTSFNNTQFNYNSDGIMTPSLNRFGSTADGTFTTLASDLHDMGLKFGLHMMRGINKRFYDNVNKSETIGNTSYTFGDLQINDNGAAWLGDNYGLVQSNAAQAWYDLMIDTYASWGLDYIKIDDIAAPTYRTGEVNMLRNAIDKVYNQTGRQIILSLSPGPTAVGGATADHVQDHANLWRITNDMWDRWDHVDNMFERANEWTPYRTPGAWPDNDMLPLGTMGIRAHDLHITNQGQRDSLLTDHEERTLLTLWHISRSPLMFGGDWTLTKQSMIDMLTNTEALEVNLASTNNREVDRQSDNGAPGSTEVYWAADSTNHSLVQYFAMMNRGGHGRTLELALSELGYATTDRVMVRDLWANQNLFVLTGDSNVTIANVGQHASHLLGIIKLVEADLNQDGNINTLDIDIIASNWLQTVPTAADGDLTGDGLVDALDLLELSPFWHQGLGGQTSLTFEQAIAAAGLAIPEPASLSLLGLAGWCLLVRRRR